MIFNFQFSTFNYFVYLHPKGDTVMFEFIVYILVMYVAIKISMKTAGAGHSFRK